ncbi:MAG: EsaB/YukD family protein [Anaerolinea sp.]|nr:EsaB/YukD family protein [Anaerolinea sp.]
MTNRVKLVIIHPGGTRKSTVEVPNNVAIGRLLRALIPRLDLPVNFANGRPITYYLMRQVEEGFDQQLDPDKTLGEQEISDDDVLALYPEMVAGGGDDLGGLIDPAVLEKLTESMNREQGLRRDEVVPQQVELTARERDRLVEMIAVEVQMRLDDFNVKLIEQQKTSAEDRAKLAEATFERSIFGKPSASQQYHCDAFMIMPFNRGFEPVFNRIIEPLFRELGMIVKKGDAFVSHTGVFMDEIWSAIYNARFVVVECSLVNANVYYELGIAHTLAKPAILLTSDISTMPADLRHRRHIVYENSIDGADKLRAELKNYILMLDADLRSGKTGNE